MNKLLVLFMATQGRAFFYGHKMSDSYYQFYPGDYLRDTQGLTLTEHGAYRILLDHYYCEEKLPSDNDRLYRICRAFSEIERDAVDFVIQKFFKINGDGYLINKRAERELEKRRKFIEEQSRKGKLSALKRNRG